MHINKKEFFAKVVKDAAVNGITEACHLGTPPIDGILVDVWGVGVYEMTMAEILQAGIAAKGITVIFTGAKPTP